MMNELERKKCKGECGKEYPNTLKYFSKKGNKLRDICKECDKKLRKERLKKEKENTNKSRIVLSEKEEKAFSEKAKEFNMSRTDFIKLIVSKGEGEILVKIEPKCFDNFNYQIMGIAANVNQITHICNTVKNVYQTDVENLRNELLKIRDWQSKLEEEFKMIDTSIKYSHEVLTFDDI
jgi:Bacterial mobilisation protein (MobC)